VTGNGLTITERIVLAKTEELRQRDLFA